MSGASRVTPKREVFVDGEEGVRFYLAPEEPMPTSLPVSMKKIDELSKEEIDALFEVSNQEMHKLEARWAGLAQQTEQERTRSVERDPPLHAGAGAGCLLGLDQGGAGSRGRGARGEEVAEVRGP